MTLPFEDAQFIPHFSRKETCLGYIWDLIYFWDIAVTYLRNILGISWAYLEKFLKNYLRMHLAYSGHIIGAYLAHIWGVSLENIGPIFDIS